MAVWKWYRGPNCRTSTWPPPIASFIFLVWSMVRLREPETMYWSILRTQPRRHLSLRRWPVPPGLTPHLPLQHPISNSQGVATLRNIGVTALTWPDIWRAYTEVIDPEAAPFPTTIPHRPWSTLLPLDQWLEKPFVRSLNHTVLGPVHVEVPPRVTRPVLVATVG